MNTVRNPKNTSLTLFLILSTIFEMVTMLTKVIIIFVRSKVYLSLDPFFIVIQNLSSQAQFSIV